MALTINGEETDKLVLKQKEGKRIKVTYSVPIGTATFSLICKDSDDQQKFLKVDADFDKSEIESQIVYVILTVSDLDLVVGQYALELKTVWNVSDSVDKTKTIKLKIEKSLFI